MISIRLPDTIEKQLNNFSKSQHTSKTEVIKQALNDFFSRKKKLLNPYELGKEYFGKYSLEDENMSKNYKMVLKRKLIEKHNR